MRAFMIFALTGAIVMGATSTAEAHHGHHDHHMHAGAYYPGHGNWHGTRWHHHYRHWGYR